jgi:hypothetical protein
MDCVGSIKLLVHQKKKNRIEKSYECSCSILIIFNQSMFH